jgi:hypothetical protein
MNPQPPGRWPREVGADEVADAVAAEVRLRRKLKRLTLTILAVGFMAALGIFVVAAPAAEDPLGDPMQSKKYIHDMEVYGGKANVLAAQFREWFASLWQGRNLAYTVAVLTLASVPVARFFATPLPSEPESEPGPESPDARR